MSLKNSIKNIKLNTLWESLHSSYWFVPTIMVIMAIALAFGMLNLDRMGKSGLAERLYWVYTGGPDGARTLLSVIASSMITIAGTTFSIVIVALTLASSQFGPRLLRNFMNDTGNQVVLGTFIATFIYCLLVLRTVRKDDYTIFVPQISITVSLVLAIVSIGVLIYFIHHASTSIQSWHVVEEVGKELDNATDRIFPEKVGKAESDIENLPKLERIPADFMERALSIQAESSGYIQVIDENTLMKITQSEKLLLRLNYRPGRFVVAGTSLLMVYPKNQVTAKIAERLKGSLILGAQRTEQQDIEFSINQLVEIAIRAISPGVNDPFTAIRCIDQLSAALCRLSERDFPSPYRFDEKNQLRIIIADPIKFPELTNAAFNKIRQYSKPDIAVVIKLLEAITVIAKHTQNEENRAALLHHAQMIRSNSKEVSEESDRKDIHDRYLIAIKALGINVC